MDKQEVKERWQECRDHFDVLYNDCEDDWRFLYGENQWDEKARSARDKGSRPCLTLNQLLPYAHQVVNDIRQARMAIRVTPVDSNADIETAEVLAGIIRNIEAQSNADSVYTTASMNAVGAGVGWIKVKTDYADIDTFDQEIYLDRILDFRSVYLDPCSDKIDGSDAEYAFVLDSYTKDRFEEIYPDAQAVSFDDRFSEDEIVIAEFYYKKYKNDTIHQIRLIDGSIQVINNEQKNAIDEDGTVIYELLAERKVEIPYVKKCIYSGAEDPLEEEEFPCKYIPLVPVIGEEVYIDNKREFHSLIRQAKDAQQMYNYWKSASTEFIALQPKAPWIAPNGSFQSYPNKWANSNTENFAFLEYDIVYDDQGQRVEPPTRAQPIQGSPAMMQEAMGARDDIRLAIGMPQSNMGEAAGEISGIAIRNRQIEGDNSTFHFVDNLAASISQVGRILVDMIPRVYSERQVMRIIGEDGEEKNIPVNQPYVKQEGEIRAARRNEPATGIYDLSIGKYDVVCDVGASYSSKRQETADKLIQLINAKPEIADITADLLFEALDLPMNKEIAERIRATMDPTLLAEDPQVARLKEAETVIKGLQERLMNYEAALQDKKENEQHKQNVDLKKLQNDSAKIRIDAETARADIQKTLAETRQIRVETGTQGRETNAETIQILTETISNLTGRIDDIGSAVGVIIDAKESEQVPFEPDLSEENTD